MVSVVGIRLVDGAWKGGRREPASPGPGPMWGVRAAKGLEPGRATSSSRWMFVAAWSMVYAGSGP